MIILVGASASGKTEVAKMLHKKYNIVKMITTTTRPMRVNEINGRDYFFVSKEEFIKRLNNNEFIEYTFYNDNYYGSGKNQIGPNKCIVVDPKGLKAFQNLNNPSIKTFFLFSKEETRFKRMIARGDNEKDAIIRIKKDRVEFGKDKYSNIDCYVDSENQTIEQVCDFVYQKYLELISQK